VEEVITEKVAIDEEELIPEATTVCIKPSNHEDLNKLLLFLE